MTSGLPPHGGMPVGHFGESLEKAGMAMVMLHGRGATVESILELAMMLAVPGVAFLAPQAHEQTWYPRSFLSPLESNEPGITSGLSVLRHILDVLESKSVKAENVFLFGFSQGACLALEFAVRNPRRYAAVIGLSGGLIGPPGTVWAGNASLESTPVFLGCSDNDPHIPQYRFLETSEALKSMGGAVDACLYPGLGHAINGDEIRVIKRMLGQSIAGGIVGEGDNSHNQDSQAAVSKNSI